MMIVNNEAEQKSAITEANHAMIDINSGIGGEIVGNTITADASTLTGGLGIRVAGSRISVDGNYINYSTAVQPMVSFGGTLNFYGPGNFIGNNGSLSGTVGTNYRQGMRFAGSGGLVTYIGLNTNNDVVSSTAVPVTCSGTPTAGFAVSNGIVTHC
jgi:hypothetical protein